MKIFFDTEFTGLHQKTTLISLGMIAQSGETFYAEFTDYDKAQVDEWIEANVISSLVLDKREPQRTEFDWEIKGTVEEVAELLKKWLNFDDEKIEMWSDCLSYDWVLFCELFGGAMNIPKNIYYIPFDLATIFYNKGIDPDINREEFVKENISGPLNKHNAKWDAYIMWLCYKKLMKL